VRSPFLELHYGFILARNVIIKASGQGWILNFSKMGVSVAGGPTPGRRNSEDQGSAEYKLRLSRSSLCYLGYPPHSCLSYLPYSLYLRLLFNGKDSTRNRNFLFIDMQQVAILKVHKCVSFFGNEWAIWGVCAH